MLLVYIPYTYKAMKYAITLLATNQNVPWRIKSDL